MPSDITSIEEVQAGDYTVRVGKAAKAGAWEATVISEGSSDPSPHMAGMYLTFGASPKATPGDDSSAGVEGPPVCAPHKWVAVGFAIEAYEWRNTDTEVSVKDGYEAATGESRPDVEPPLEDADIDADELAKELADSDAGGGSDFPGPWDPEGNE